jgi:hypothetical protein
MNPHQLSGDAGDVPHRKPDLIEGTYKLDVAVHKRDGYPYDYHRLLYTFRVKSRTQEVVSTAAASLDLSPGAVQASTRLAVN